MAPKKNEDHFRVIITVVPPPQRQRQQIQSSKVERATKAVYKNDHGRISNKVTKTYKAEKFVVKTTGRLGNKQEANCSCTKKYDDKRGRQQIQLSEVKRATKAVYKDDHGRSSKQSTKTKSYKAEGFVDKTTGRMAFKEEAQYSSTKKYDDKKQGYTHEYQTQVKHKHMAYPIKDASKSSSSNNKCIIYY